MTRVVIHNHIPVRDASEGLRGMMERKAAKISEAKAGEERMARLLERVKAAKKIIKKRGDTPWNGYAANAEHLVTRAKATFGLVINQLNQGMLYRFDEMMAEAKEPERIASEATYEIERQAAERRA